MTASQHPISATSYIKTPMDDNRRTRDVGSPTMFVREPGHQPQPILKVQDPFLYYSNDQVRMKELLLQDDDSSDDESSPTSLSDQEQQTTTSVRKTRISFELHPSLLLEDLMDELLLDDSLNFDDIPDASLPTDEQDSDEVSDTINILRRIMFS
jgi:hypothetical protein